MRTIRSLRSFKANLWLLKEGANTENFKESQVYVVLYSQSHIIKIQRSAFTPVSWAIPTARPVFWIAATSEEDHKTKQPTSRWANTVPNTLTCKTSSTVSTTLRAAKTASPIACKWIALNYQGRIGFSCFPSIECPRSTLTLNSCKPLEAKTWTCTSTALQDKQANGLSTLRIWVGFPSIKMQMESSAPKNQTQPHFLSQVNSSWPRSCLSSNPGNTPTNNKRTTSLSSKNDHFLLCPSDMTCPCLLLPITINNQSKSLNNNLL